MPRSDWLRGGGDGGAFTPTHRHAQPTPMRMLSAHRLQLALALDPAALSPSTNGSNGGRQPYHSHADCAQRCACRRQRFVPCVRPGRIFASLA